MLALILGDRDTRLQRVVSRLLGRDAMDDLHLTQFDATEDKAEDIINAASMDSFFGEGQRILVHNARLPTRNDNLLWEWITQFASSLPETLNMVVTFHTDGLNHRERTRNEKKARTVEQKGIEVHIVPPLNSRSARTTRGWILDVVRENDMTIDPDAVDYLVEHLSSDASALEQEILKISALLGFSGTISRADIEEANPYPPEEVVWDYLKAVLQNRPGKALEILTAVLSQGAEPEFILAILGTNLRRLLDVDEMTRSNIPVEKMQSALHVANWQMKRLQDEAHYFRPGELKTMLAKLVELDMCQKTGALRHGGLTHALYAVTVRFCYRIFTGAGSGTGSPSQKSV